VTSLLANIPPPPAPGLQLGPLDLRMYGLLIAIGAYLALRLAVTRYEKLGGDPDLAEKALLIGLVCGLVGARIGYLIPRFFVSGSHGEPYLTRPLDALAIWQGGLTIFGGLFFGALGAVVYLRRRQMDVPAMLTAVAPALPLAQAIGRWGNYFNQELFGRPTDLPWALEVEAHRRPAQYANESTFHPTFLYESLWNLALVGVLLWIDRRGKLKRGSLIFVYLIGYGIGRAWIEALRVDTEWRDPVLGLSRNNLIALFIIAVGALGLWWWQRRTPAADEVEELGAVDADADADAAPEGEVDAATESTAGGATPVQSAGEGTTPAEGSTPTRSDVDPDPEADGPQGSANP
jgi:prolipoprotein diacylglyceryl transferase